jgi:hypothetical protein
MFQVNVRFSRTYETGMGSQTDSNLFGTTFKHECEAKAYIMGLKTITNLSKTQIKIKLNGRIVYEN